MLRACLHISGLRQPATFSRDACSCDIIDGEVKALFAIDDAHQCQPDGDVIMDSQDTTLGPGAQRILQSPPR